MVKKNAHKSNKVFISMIAILLIALALESFFVLQLLKENKELKENNPYARIEKIKQGLMPSGNAPYAQEFSLSYDQVERSLQTLVAFHKQISLNSKEKERYIKIGTTPHTACEFCCGVGSRGFASSSGRLNCECAHNIAFSGLTKYLIKNTDMSDQEILEEIKKWKALFFPREMLSQELEKQGIDPEIAGLPKIVGGC